MSKKRVVNIAVENVRNGISQAAAGTKIEAEIFNRANSKMRAARRMNKSEIEQSRHPNRRFESDYFRKKFNITDKFSVGFIFTHCAEALLFTASTYLLAECKSTKV